MTQGDASKGGAGAPAAHTRELTGVQGVGPQRAGRSPRVGKLPPGRARTHTHGALGFRKRLQGVAEVKHKCLAGVGFTVNNSRSVLKKGSEELSLLSFLEVKSGGFGAVGQGEARGPAPPVENSPPQPTTRQGARGCRSGWEPGALLSPPLVQEHTQTPSLSQPDTQV